MSSDEFDAAANRLGALAFRLTDRIALAVEADTGLSLSSATALSALLEVVDHPTVDRLADVLGLTSSGTVRLLDGLVDRGLVARKSGADGRVRVVQLTAAGRRLAERVKQARAGVVTDALSLLSAQERRHFSGLVDRVLANLVRGQRGRGWMCRLCATGVCGARPGQPCPVAIASGIVSDA